MKTSTFSIDNVGDPEAIVVESYCDTVIVYEQNQAGTTDYDVFAPLKTNTPVRRPAGAKTELRKSGKYHPGDIAGYIAAVTSGTYTFAKEEH